MIPVNLKNKIKPSSQSKFVESEDVTLEDNPINSEDIRVEEKLNDNEETLVSNVKVKPTIKQGSQTVSNLRNIGKLFFNKSAKITDKSNDNEFQKIGGKKRKNKKNKKNKRTKKYRSNKNRTKRRNRSKNHSKK
jgi:hypothetical protein